MIQEGQWSEGSRANLGCLPVKAATGSHPICDVIAPKVWVQQTKNHWNPMN